MPKEIKKREEFLKLAEKAIECRVKRHSEIVKIKLRLKRYLYTIKVSHKEAEELLKNIKCPIKEL